MARASGVSLAPGGPGWEKEASGPLLLVKAGDGSEGGGLLGGPELRCEQDLPLSRSVETPVKKGLKQQAVMQAWTQAVHIGL